MPALERARCGPKGPVLANVQKPAAGEWRNDDAVNANKTLNLIDAELCLRR